MSHRVIEQGESHGLPYLIVEVRGQHLCGYVRIPEDHVLYERPYTDRVPERLIRGRMYDPVRTPAIAMFCQAQDGHVSLDLALDVHGGITFAGPHYVEGVEGWWFGFDCAHADDDRNVQDEAYVRRECEGLAKQIAEWDVPASEITTRTLSEGA